MMLRTLVAAALTSITYAWTPAAAVRHATKLAVRPIHIDAAEEKGETTEAIELGEIQSLEALEADYWGSLNDVERQIQGASKSAEAFLRQGQLEDALEQFNKAQELSQHKRYEWHRGVCLYYLDQLADAQSDFVANAQRYEGRFGEPASEERLFARACALRGETTEAFAAASEVRETRPVLRACAQLFDGDEGALATLRDLCVNADTKDAMRRRLFGHFYVGLYHDAKGDAEKAKAHLALATSKVSDEDFTTRLPHLHATVRGWSLDDVPPEALASAARFGLGGDTARDAAPGPGTYAAAEAAATTGDAPQPMEDILGDPAILREGIDAMTVAMLKEALKARGLKRTGLKAALKARLLEDLGL